MKQVRHEERVRYLRTLPISSDEAQSLFAYLGLHLSQSPFDKTLIMTRDWCKLNAVDEETVIAWVRNNSGFCDCEVLSNMHDGLSGAMQSLPVCDPAWSKLPG